MKKILVIDDDLETCRFLKEIFSDQGWDISYSQTDEGARVFVRLVLKSYSSVGSALWKPLSKR
jgi:hypothetical protein